MWPVRVCPAPALRFLLEDRVRTPTRGSVHAVPPVAAGAALWANWGHTHGVGQVRSAVTGLFGLWLLLGACAGPNLWTDLSSVSTGRSNRGRLRKPARLPADGPGYRVPQKWADRGFQFGTDELVAAIQRAASRVAGGDRRVQLGVADLGRNRGGWSKWHGSHQSGRDVDLLFYTTDGRARPMGPPQHDMLRFSADGIPAPAPYELAGLRDAAWSTRRFDDRRNWELLEALLTDPTIRLQWVFVSTGLKVRLLEWAHAHHRPNWLIAYADVVLRQPGDAPPHDNHFHVRIYCSRADRFHGCEERGVVWQHEKKTFKYGGPERYDPVLWRRLGLRSGFR